MYNRSILLIFLSIFLFFPLLVSAENKIVINEFLSRPSSESNEWVEFYNPDKNDISSYWLDDDMSFTDDAGTSDKKSLANLIASTSAYPYLELSSFLNNSGDHVVLFDATGNVLDQYQYQEDPGLDTVIGRSPDGTGQFQILASSTQGEINSAPLPTLTTSPTEAPTPTEISTPTKVPTPTKAPTPTKTPTPSKTPTPTNAPTPTPKSPSTSTTKIPTLSPTKIASLGARPTAILGISTNSATVKPSPKKAQIKEKSEVQSREDSQFPFLITSIGISIVFIGCAILFFLKIKRSQKTV